MFFQQNGSKHLVQATAQQLQLRHICRLRGAFWYHVLLKVKKAKELGGRGGGVSHLTGTKPQQNSDKASASLLSKLASCC